jgi:catechol 2,3-dioxygenase-like lactoylglutathione lyase family enzyme
MKRFLRSILLHTLVATTLASAHAGSVIECEWIFSGGGDKSDKARGVAFDRQGNAFLAAETTGDSSFGSLTHRSAGGMDCVLIKLDPEGRPLWLRSIGGSAIDRAYAVACDEQGNAYITGHYESTDAIADNIKLPNAGSYDLFVAKYSPEGRLLWIRTGGGPGYDYGHAITVDKKGHVIVSGSLAAGGKLADKTSVPEGSPSAVFCAKYDAEGTLLWAKTTSGSLGGSGHGIATDGENDILIGGSLSGSGNLFGTEVKPEKTSAFVCKLDASGNILWHHLSKGSPSAVYHEITCDASGRVWAVGMFKGSVSIDATTYTSTNDKDNDGIIVSLNQKGRVQWTKNMSGPATDYCLGVAVDEHGTAFVCGDFHGETTLAGKRLSSMGSGDLFIAAFDPAGNLDWLQQAGGAGNDSAYPIAFRAPDQLLIGGSISAPAALGKRELKQAAGADAYSAKWRIRPIK